MIATSKPWMRENRPDTSKVDLETVEPDPDWRPHLFGYQRGPFDGRTYVAAITREDLAGSRRTYDVRFNVQGSEAFWFWSPEFMANCPPGY